MDLDAETFTVHYGSTCTIEDLENPALFTGWYDSWSVATRRLVSADNPYTFLATGNMVLAPGYMPAENLSASGKANCYIAPKLNSGYRFDARTMGNGRHTPGIVPRTLSGSSARVLWETGQTRGAVVRAVSYSGGQIYFSTGGSYGNAVIGLFDERNGCIWSWHIWVTDYSPAASAQTYTGGPVVMDRNLGATSSAGGGISSRGLYYQWGRKDPFLYPSSTASAGQYAASYAPGYSYTVADPLAGPGGMSVDYAVGHPCTFMCGAYPGGSDPDIPNWLSPANPNLWGNTSTASALSDAGMKSIYDPCPPGWRVPDRRMMADASLVLTGSTARTCYFLRYDGISTTAFPMGGWWDATSFLNNGAAAYVWTNAPAEAANYPGYYKDFSTALKVSATGVEPLYRVSRDKALPVRCVKE